MKLAEQIVELLEIESPLTLQEITQHFITIGYEPPNKAAGMVTVMVNQALFQLAKKKMVQRESTVSGRNHYFLSKVNK